MHKIKRSTKQETRSTHGSMHRLIYAYGYNIWNKEEKIITIVIVIALEFGKTTLLRIRYCPSIMHGIAQQHDWDIYCYYF